GAAGRHGAAGRRPADRRCCGGGQNTLGVAEGVGTLRGAAGGCTGRVGDRHQAPRGGRPGRATCSLGGAAGRHIGLRVSEVAMRLGTRLGNLRNTVACRRDVLPLQAKQDAPPLRTAADVLDLLEHLAAAVRADPWAGAAEKARAAGYLASVALKAIEVGNLASRIELLEAVLQQPPKGTTAGPSRPSPSSTTGSPRGSACP